MSNKNTEMLIHQANAQIEKVWTIGLKWCDESGQNLDIRNYMLICLRMIITKGLTLYDNDQQKMDFCNEIIKKLNDLKEEIVEASNDN